MAKSEIEIIKYPKLRHIKMFVNELRSVDNHLHNDFEILVVLDSVGIAKVNAISYELEKGDIFFINSGDVHSISRKMPFEESVGDPKILCIQISNHFIREYFPQIQTTLFKSTNLKNILSSEDYKNILNLIVDVSIDYFIGSDFYQLDVVSKVAKTFSYIYKNLEHEIINEGQKQKIRRKSNRLERIISYIDENFDSQIRLEDITSRENLSVTHFSHLFSSSFGMTFQEFINIKRMEQCIRLMSNKEKTLLEICYESGFSDPKYMNKMFLKKYGCTPKEFRKKYSEYNEAVLVNNGTFENIYNNSDSLKEVQAFKKELEM